MSGFSRRRLLARVGATGALVSLGCAGLDPGDVVARIGKGGPPQLDKNAPDRRPTTGRVKEVPPGFERVRQDQDGLERESLFLRPSGSGKRPLLIGLHGNSGSSEWMYERCGLADVCREQKWFGLFPECDVWSKRDPKPDFGDVRYLTAVIERVIGEAPIDRSRIVAMGFSGGGMRAYRLAAQASQYVSAIAVCAGTVGHTGDALDGWRPDRHRAQPVSILHVHGKRDRTVDPRGGTVDGRPGVKRVAVTDGMQVWAKHLGASEVKDPRRPKGCPSNVNTRRWEAPGGQVLQAVIDPRLGHTWADYMTEAAVAFLRKVPGRT